MRISHTSAIGTRYEGSFTAPPTPEQLEALDAIADAARRLLTPDPQETPPAAALLGTDEHTPTPRDDRGLERQGQGRHLSGR